MYPDTALLKAAPHYVLHYHLERTWGKAGRPAARSRDLQRIVSFARATRTGDKSEFADVPGLSRLGPCHLDPGELPGAVMPRFRDCFRDGARREALAADIVVVNHHLFFADVMLKDEGMAELCLPAIP